MDFDLIIIGAGINGAGIARDAAMRGLRVLLLDKGDVASGTSSASTRLIHGGLRYLEHGEFGLVRESLRERETLMRIAPHLVRPLPILIPIYRSARRGPWTIRAGMVAYDLLSFSKKLPRHQMLSRADALKHTPGLQPDGLLGAALYYDAQVEFPERLVLENVLSAVEHGAKILTYTQVKKLIIENGSVRAIEFQSACPVGTTAQDGTSQGQEGVLAATLTSATAPIVINAAGPWVDHVLAEGTGSSSRLIGGTKGSHIVVGAFSGSPQAAIYVEAEADGRPFFIIPWNHNYLIGTTDIRYDGALDHVEIDEDEIAYLLREANRVLPGAKLTRHEILYTYSGVRPLPFTRSEDEASVTRKHFIRVHPRIANMFSIVGGKLTTYRSLAEEAADLVMQRLGRNHVECTSGKVTLPGALYLDLSRDARLTRIYGRRASLILKVAEDDPALATVVDEETGAIAAEIVFAFKNELAETLSDCLLRRTMIGWNSSRGRNAVEVAATVAKEYLGWSDERADKDVADYLKSIGNSRADVSKV